MADRAGCTPFVRKTTPLHVVVWMLDRWSLRQRSRPPTEITPSHGAGNRARPEVCRLRPLFLRTGICNVCEAWCNDPTLACRWMCGRGASSSTSWQRGSMTCCIAAQVPFRCVVRVCGSAHKCIADSDGATQVSPAPLSGRFWLSGPPSSGSPTRRCTAICTLSCGSACGACPCAAADVGQPPFARLCRVHACIPT